MSAAEKFREVLEEIKSLPTSREKRLALEKLEECAYWTSCARNGITSGIEHVSDAPVKLRLKGPASS